MPNNIIEELKNQGIKMKPKWYFVLKGFLWTILIIISLVLAIFFLSLVLFSCCRPFPWFLLLLLIVSVAVAEYLFNELGIVYRKPIIYSLLVIVVMMFIAGMFLNRIHFHESIQRKNIPGMQKIYKRYPGKIMRNPGLEIKNTRKL